jgi:hypothetical protein
VPPGLLSIADEVIESRCCLLRCISLLLALFRLVGVAIERRLSGQKRTLERATFRNIRWTKSLSRVAASLNRVVDFFNARSNGGLARPVRRTGCNTNNLDWAFGHGWITLKVKSGAHAVQ